MPPEADKTVATAPPLLDAAVKVRVRSYQAADYEAALAVFIPGMMCYAEVPGQSREFWENYIEKSLKDDWADIEGTYFAAGGHFWVAVVDRADGGEEIVGTVAIERNEDGNGELRRMSVKSEYRRYGVGKLLVTTLEAWATEHAYKRIWFSCGYVQEQAHHFYKTMGYSIFKDEIFHNDPVFVRAHFEKFLVQPSA